MNYVGLTGGIGSGKSYVARIFQNLGIPIYEADLRARELSDSNPAIRKKIIDIFGDNAYQNEELNRNWIGGQVFSQVDLLEKLNQIIHPEVDSDFSKWCTENNEAPYIIKEAAILFETGSFRKMNYNILVTAPEWLRIERVGKRDLLITEEIRKRMENQWDDNEKLKLADFVIINDGKSLILPEVLNIHQKLTQNI